ncbi:MAG: helix-turn-helix domain-containing protein [Actinomycetales bacterium]|nr:MAG: helix-turn-helix domain-containing protein [Actinomycetales bacterium]
MTWQQLLADEGVTTVVVDADHVMLLEDNIDARDGRVVRLIVSPTPVYPSRILKWADGEPTLLVVPSASESTVLAAASNGWGVIAEDGKMRLRLRSRLIERPAGHDELNSKRSPGPVARSKFVVGRVLLAQMRPVGQGELASMSGASQPMVSRAVSELRTLGLVRPGRSAVLVEDWQGLARWWLDRYPGPGGPTSYWFGLDPVMEQVAAAAKALKGAVFSGSAAADMLSPWQRPDFVVAYTRAPALLSDAGFVPVTDPAAATMMVTAPIDESVWCREPMTKTVNGIPVPIADPMQVAYDVLHGPESGTRTEVVDRLLRELEGPLRVPWSQAWEPHSDDR